MADMAHVLVFPVPAQGHLNSFLHLSTGLLGAGLHVTFLHTDHILRCLGTSATAASPRLRFLSVPDGLPDDDPRDVAGIPRLMEALRTTAAASFRDLLASLRRAGNDGFPPVTCVIADGIMPFMIDIAEDLGVPAIAYRTVSACSVLAYLSVPKLIELGELPFPEDPDLDEPIRDVPGMETFLRRRDLPVWCRSLTDTYQDPVLEAVVAATVHSSRKARALMLNTSTSLDRPSLAHLAKEIRGEVFAVGPIHSMSPAPAAATSLWRHDDACMSWLDGLAEKSVVYISLGSLTVISHEQFTEFLRGLVAAGYPFLWVVRPDMVGASQDAALREAVAAVGEDMARVVPWAPQRDVLRHRAVGCFLTHSGWNSTVEGIVEGVPMVCWPFFADQQVNSRFVGAVWRSGLDMKDVCERDVVEKTVREAMESAEIRRSAEALARQVERDVADGGASALEFKRLVGFIRELSSTSAAENDLQIQE